MRPAAADAEAPVRLGTFHGCTNDDKYPYQMCSLKTVTNTASPPLFPNGAHSPCAGGQKVEMCAPLEQATTQKG
jgi:hypothetical protein